MQKTPLVLIGNSPSSGSTFLADLLDSSSWAASGPESGIFLNTSLNEWSLLQSSIEKTTISKTYYRVKNFPVYKGLYGWGLDRTRLHEMYNRFETAKDFNKYFSQRFLALRGKKKEAVVFEKTPENIGNIEAILKSNTPFLVVYRNPLHVISSLKKRGFSTLKALTTWMIDIAHFLKHRENDLVTAIAYEDLIKNPFKITQSIIEKYSGKTEEQSTIEKQYQDNNYRNFFAVRVDSWDHQEIGASVPKLKPFTKEDQKLLSKIKEAKISIEAAEIYGIEPLSFSEIIEQLGYQDLLPTPLKEKSNLKIKPSEKLKLSRKFAHGIKSGQLKPTDWNAFSQPVKLN